MSEKTEYPTSQKLRKAREDGQVAKSKDFTQTVLIVAIFGYMLSDSEALFKALAQIMVLPVQSLGLSFDEAVNTVVTELFWASVRILMPFLLIVIGLGLFIELVQTGMLFSFKSLMPSAKKLNVISNVKNTVSIKNLVEFLKSNLKIAFLSALLYLVLKDALPVLMSLPEGGLPAVGVAVGILLKVMVSNIAVAYTAIALADFAWQRHQHIKDLMMSIDEIKQEHKQSEGDQHIKHQRKHLHQEMLAEGAVNSSRKASVLVTNPTHLAIAIYYEKDVTPLPVVLAKGEGALATRMIVAARESGVPILQNIPLAHALMNTALLDQYIPSELIEPVAEVLRLVQGLSRDQE
jgi:type III secretion protein U